MTAPIKLQCSRDYFYSKNPVFENGFTEIEGLHKELLTKIVYETYVPRGGSHDHHTLMALILFQAGRTATTAAHQDHLAEQFGKATLRKDFEMKGDERMLRFLQSVNISLPGGEDCSSSCRCRRIASSC